MIYQNLEIVRSHFLVIEKDEPILGTIEKWANENKIAGATFAAIGAIKQAELGFYDLHKKDYIRQSFNEGDFELISFTGNLSIKDNKKYAHAHVSLGREDFSVIGGHLFEAKVAVTTEILVHEFNKSFARKMDHQLGLQTICEFLK